MGFTMSQGGVLTGSPSISTPVGSSSPQFTVKDSTNNSGCERHAGIDGHGHDHRVSSVAARYSRRPVWTSDVPCKRGHSSLHSPHNLPNGLNFSLDGVLSGSPSPGSQGSYTPSFTVTDAKGILSVDCPVRINH